MNDIRPGRKLRLVLLTGFGGLLALLLFAGLDALRVLRNVHTAEEQARSAFLARNESLVTFRTYLDAYGDRVQQYFLAQGPAEELPKLSQQIAGALDAYPPDRQPDEDALLTTLRAMVVEQERAVKGGLAAGRRDNRYLCDEVLPRSARLLETSGQFAIWNHERFRGEDAALLTQFDAVQGNLTKLLILVLGSGLALAIGSIVYIAGQDREAHSRYAELSGSREALSQLSARLLDAQEEERRSISRELHDEVGQSLGALLVDVARLSALLPGDDARVREQLGKIKSVAESSVNSVRNISLLLRPSMLDDLGLMAAVEWQGREVSRRSEMEVEIESAGVSEALAEDYKICIYRVTQEALNNAARHSGARHAWVRIAQTPTAITVSVRDDGRGFEPDRTRGLGLLGMEERVRRLGGKLHIESKTGQGATLTAELPTR
jgi:signal transduction histidine kinase